MVEVEKLFNRESYPDTIKPLIEEMDKLSESLEYEKAKVLLGKIKTELKISKSNFPFKIDTIKEVYDMIRCQTIRLDPDNYSFADFLSLLINVHKRKNELKGMSYSDTDRQRKIVAEEMAKLGITIPANRKGIKPNRRFLDIAHQVNPFIANKELERREKVMLWKAIESGHAERMKMAVGNIHKYKSGDV